MREFQQNNMRVIASGIVSDVGRKHQASESLPVSLSRMQVENIHARFFLASKIRALNYEYAWCRQACLNNRLQFWVIRED